MRKELHFWPLFHSITIAPELRKALPLLKRAYLDTWNYTVNAYCTETAGNHDNLFQLLYTNCCLYMTLFFLPSRDFQIVPWHMLMSVVNTWPSWEELDLHYIGMLWSFTLEWARDMLYNHGINSSWIVISHTAMRSPSITWPKIKYGKLSSAATKIGIIKIILCTLTCGSFSLSWTICLFHFQH